MSCYSGEDSDWSRKSGDSALTPSSSTILPLPCSSLDPFSPIPTPCPYILGKAVGKGSFGAVFAATLLRDRQQFSAAVKKPHTDASTGKVVPVILRSFQAELHVASLLSPHPSLVRLLTSETDADTGCPTLIYEWGGIPLSTALSQGWFINIRAVVERVASGLQHLHDHGFAHHDVNFTNILIQHDLDVKLCDYGMGATNPSVVCTLPFRSPEAILRRHMASPVVARAVDVWCLGVVAYGLITRSWLLPHSLLAAVSTTSLSDREILLPVLVRCLWTPEAEAVLPERFWLQNLPPPSDAEKYTVETFKTRFKAIPKGFKELIGAMLNLNWHNRITLDEVLRLVKGCAGTTVPWYIRGVHDF